MANSILDNLYYGSDIFDVMSFPVNWIQGPYMPDPDDLMNYRRTLSYKRPFILSMNTNFSAMTTAYVEQYFQYCLFYGKNFSFSPNFQGIYSSFIHTYFDVDVCKDKFISCDF